MEENRIVEGQDKITKIISKLNIMQHKALILLIKQTNKRLFQAESEITMMRLTAAWRAKLSSGEGLFWTLFLWTTGPRGHETSQEVWF